MALRIADILFTDSSSCLRYCSPTVDLAFFIFLNTSAALRAEHWDDLFLEYFRSLKNTLDLLLDGHPVDKDFGAYAYVQCFLRSCFKHS